MLCLSAAPRAKAWGCKGHQTVALIAEKHLTPEAREFVAQIFSGAPIDPQTKRLCGTYVQSQLADGSTWPDDIRNEERNGTWHYINIPRGATKEPPEKFCGTESCITEAIARQWAILKDKKSDPRKRAEALRYLTHFVGDLHMPLHASTNNDLGGNCVPVRYFRRRPREHNHSFAPNLHSVWDTAIVERDMESADPMEYAEQLERAFAGDEPAWNTAGIHMDEWTWESHDLAETIVYGELSPKDPSEPPVQVKSCSDADNVGNRNMQMHYSIGESYQEIAAPVMQERLAQAGVRLAMMINEAARVSK